MVHKEKYNFPTKKCPMERQTPKPKLGFKYNLACSDKDRKLKMHYHWGEKVELNEILLPSIMIKNMCDKPQGDSVSVT